jgi:hypothetical protein
MDVNERSKNNKEKRTTMAKLLIVAIFACGVGWIVNHLMPSSSNALFHVSGYGITGTMVAFVVGAWFCWGRTK